MVLNSMWNYSLLLGTMELDLSSVIVLCKEVYYNVSLCGHGFTVSDLSVFNILAKNIDFHLRL